MYDIMGEFAHLTYPARRDHSTEQMNTWRQAVLENRLKLEDIQKQRQRVEQETLECSRESEQRMELTMANSGVIDVLQQLGQMLLKERDLSEQLNGQISEDRNRNLEERSERLTNKARSLTAEILEVQQLLAEAKTRNVSAEALSTDPL
ncbi:hypothetical protein JOB18_021326 [Solea senegalensis]|nr:hypothetical protein JOB18_021326 [Solea senegalensis]